MEIKTNFMDTYTKKIDKLLNQCQTQKTIISSFWNCTILFPKKKKTRKKSFEKNAIEV